MSVVINTNAAATMAANNLAASSQLLQKSLNRLSSGSRIVSPSDDAGGLAVSMKLSATARQQGAIENNLGNSTSFLQTQDGVLNVVGQVLNRMSELKTMSLDPTKNSTDIANYNAEFAQLQNEINSLGAEKFNGISLFGSSGLDVQTTTDSTAAKVNVGAAALLGSAFTDSFANLGNWSTTDGGSGAPSVSGGHLTLPQFSTATTLANYTGPLDINMQVDFGSGPNDLIMKFGGTTISTGVVAGGALHDLSGVHAVKVSLDGMGNSNIYLDGSSVSSETHSGVPTGAQAITLGGGNDLSTTIDSFSISSHSNVSVVTSATDLGSMDLTSLTSAIQDVATYRAGNGADQSRLGFATDVLATNKANIEAANSRIADVDVAKESTRLARYNVLVQAGTAMLTQANQSEQMALKLLG